MRFRPCHAVLGLACLALVSSVLSGCSSASGQEDESTFVKEDFITLWSDGSVWCGKGNECGTLDGTFDQCMDEWVTPDQVRETIAQGGVTEAELEECYEATRAVDECVLSLSCDVYRNYLAFVVTKCAKEDRAFIKACLPMKG